MEIRFFTLNFVLWRGSKNVAEHTGKYKNAIISILRNLDLKSFLFRGSVCKKQYTSFCLSRKMWPKPFLSQITKVKHFFPFFFF